MSELSVVSGRCETAERRMLDWMELEQVVLQVEGMVGVGDCRFVAE